MKKLYLQLLAAFFTRNTWRSKAVTMILAITLSSISYSGFSQVEIVTANDTLLCSKTAVGGSAPTCTTLDTIKIIETLTGDYSAVHGSVQIAPPTGWQFCASPGLKIYLDGAQVTSFPTCSGADMCISSYALVTGAGSGLTISDSVHATTRLDTVMIVGLQVQALSTTALAGNIYAISSSNINGIVAGAFNTSFGKLALIPAPITGAPATMCTGTCVSLFDATPGGTWSSSNPAVANVSPTGVVCALTAGSVTITYTVAGCTSTATITIFASPAPILGSHNMCAWYDSLSVTDATSGGLYSSTGVTTINLGGGNGKVHANAPGVDTIFYTVASGCSVDVVLTVNPLPKPFNNPPYSVCAGSTTTLYDSVGPGTWSSSVSTVASVTVSGYDSVTVHGLLAGVTVITYTIAGTGCYLDTTFTVNPLPSPIGGPTEVCSLSTITLTDATPLGTWTSSNTFVGTINSGTGLFTGVHPGTTVVLYTLPTGCAQVTTVTVDPLPDSIVGPTVVCAGSMITLTDAVGPGLWHSTNTTIATIDSVTGVVTGVSAGTVIINYNIMPGNCGTSFIITVNPLPSPILGDTVVCQGSFISFTDTTVGGTWSSSNPPVGTIDPVSGTFGGISAGTTTICYTLSSTGCSICENVTVNLTPSAITGLDTLCVGSSVILNGSPGGGVWSTNDPAIATIDSTGTVTGIAAGTVIDTYSIGACFAVYYVTVDPVPAAIAGDSSVCIGDSVLLSDALVGGTWVSSDTTTATISSMGWVTGVATGTAFITYTLPAGGCYTIFSIIVNSKAPIVGPSSVCQGDTITLTNPDPNPFAVWSHLHPTIDSIVAANNFPAFADISGLTAGVDTITYTQPTGCASTFVLTVNPISPISGDSVVCVGDSATVFDLTPGGGPGIWSISPTTSATINPFGGVVTGITPGVDTITYTITATGCHASRLFTVNPTPGPITGPTNVCVGDSILLVDTSVGGTWSSSTPTVASIDSAGYVTGISSGIDTIRYSFSSTSCAVYYIVTVNPLSQIFGADSVCVGLIITHSDSTHGGVWSNVFTATGTIDSFGNYTGIAAGVDTIKYTLPTGCVAQLIVTVNPLPGPITGIDSVCQFATTTLSDLPTGGTWTVGNGNATIGSSSGIVTGVTPGTDTVTYTLSTGCTITTVITVNAAPAAIAGSNHVCLARTITLSDATPGGVWTSSNPAIAPVTTVGVDGQVYGAALGVDTIFYTLTVGACPAQLLVSVTPIPTITVNHPPIKCRFATDTLTASLVGGGAGLFTWTPATGLDATSGPVVHATPTVTTTYTVTGTDANSCDSFTTVTVIVDDSLDHLHIAGLDSICAGTCDLLQASGRAGSYFNWHPAVGLSCTICDTVNACPDATTTYWAVAIDDLGCKDSVSFTVTVNPIPIIQVSPTPTILCKRTPLQVQMTTTNTDNATTTWAWSPNLFLSCDSCSNPILTDTNNIVYNVIGTSIYGCYDSFKVKVSVLDTNVNTISNDTNICIGTVATLIATSHSLYSNLDVPTFTWLPDDGKLSNPDSFFTYAFPVVTTTYSVAIFENACFSDTLSVTVTVQPYPIFNLTPPSPTSIIAGTPTQLNAGIVNTPIEHYMWVPTNTLTCDTCAAPIAIPTVNTTYIVTATSIYGCTSKDSVTLLLSCDQSQVFIPNTFTPNGDGVNDRFFVSGKGLSIINSFNIYNRWGQLLFHAENIPPNDPAAGWDGTFKGLVLEPDVFVYTVEATCELGGPPLKYKGDISIVK